LVTIVGKKNSQEEGGFAGGSKRKIVKKQKVMELCT